MISSVHLELNLNELFSSIEERFQFEVIGKHLNGAFKF